MSDSARQPSDDPPARPRVGLFVTCLVDLFRPAVGFAVVRLLEDSGCVVDVLAGTAGRALGECGLGGSGR